MEYAEIINYLDTPNNKIKKSFNMQYLICLDTKILYSHYKNLFWQTACMHAIKLNKSLSFPF